MIPIGYLLSNVGMYEVEIESGIEVKAQLIDKPSLVCESISLLRSLLQTRVVGLDVKLQPSNWPWMGTTAQMLILCVANRCLIIQLGHHFDVFPLSLSKFLADETICFVGKDLSRKLASLHDYNTTCKSIGVEVGDLAAKVLKKPSISTFGLADLARETGVGSSVAEAAIAGEGSAHVDDWIARVFTDDKVDRSGGVFTDHKVERSGGVFTDHKVDRRGRVFREAIEWSSKAFTDEEIIKNAIHEAYACYVIGNKLLSML